MEDNKRYIDYTENRKYLVRVSYYDLDFKIIPIYMHVLYGYYDEKEFKSKEILLSGYAYKHNESQYVIIEYLNLDGYLEKRIYNEITIPLLFHRSI